jgi:hypothetical protein
MSTFTTLIDKQSNVLFGRHDRYLVCSWDDDHVAIAKQILFCNEELPDVCISTDRGMISGSIDMLQSVNYQILLGDTIYRYTPGVSLARVKTLNKWNEHLTTHKSTASILVNDMTVIEEFISVGCKDLQSVVIDGKRCKVSQPKNSKSHVLSWIYKKERKEQ